MTAPISCPGDPDVDSDAQLRRRTINLYLHAQAVKNAGATVDGQDTATEGMEKMKKESDNRQDPLSSVLDYTRPWIFYQVTTGFLEPPKARPRPYLHYLFNGVLNLFLTFYFNWTMLFTSPFSSAMFLCVYPTIFFCLFVFEVGLKLFMEKLGGNTLVKYISLRYGKSMSVINWGAPQLLLSDATRQLVKATLQSLGKPAAPPTPSIISGIRQRTFDLSIAQTCVVLSSLIYEREDKLVCDAYRIIAESLTGKKPSRTDVDVSAQRLLWASEARIREIASTLGLGFTGASELKSLGGPFCGLFWSNDVPCIIIAFKGTTPTNYEEFLVDATMQRTDARPFLFGSVHEGFYESVFATSAFGGDDIRDPYGAILMAVAERAKVLYDRHQARVQVWITGHSLGAATSALLFARWLKCPEDLPSYADLRDCYVIGTPAVGDSDFASTFASYTTSPLARSSTLWRLTNKSDIICHLPPGYNSRTVGHYMSEYDFFNYSHVGHAIHLTHDWCKKPMRMYPSSYQPTMQVNVVLGAYQDSDFDINHPEAEDDPIDEHTATLLKQYELELPAWMMRPFVQRWIHSLTANVDNPIRLLEAFYPPLIGNHIPHNYFQSLQRARIYYSQASPRHAKKDH